tara:strand:+ start:2602 stop:2907 length:306 start_codon:yes stop_codon:yes gene_type:complete
MEFETIKNVAAKVKVVKNLQIVEETQEEEEFEKGDIITIKAKCKKYSSEYAYLYGKSFKVERYYHASLGGVKFAFISIINIEGNSSLICNPFLSYHFEKII